MKPYISPNYILDIFSNLLKIDGITEILDYIHSVLGKHVDKPQLKEIAILYDSSFNKNEFVHGLTQLLPLIYKCNYFVSCADLKNRYLDGVLDLFQAENHNVGFKILKNGSFVAIEKTTPKMYPFFNGRRFQVGIIENAEIIDNEGYVYNSRHFVPKNIINSNGCDNCGPKNNCLAIYLIDKNKPVLYRGWSREFLYEDQFIKVFERTYEEKAVNNLKNSILEAEDERIIEEIIGMKDIMCTDPVFDIDPFI